MFYTTGVILTLENSTFTSN